MWLIFDFFATFLSCAFIIAMIFGANLITLIDIEEFRKNLMGPWEDSEEGLPLEWHW